jgi:branched-chain amino acid transport system ATP-binding protein
MTLLRLVSMGSGSWNRPISFQVDVGEVVLLLGRNGAGKTTLLNTIAGLQPVRSGSIEIEDHDATKMDEQGRNRHSIRIALEGRQVFSRLSVQRNLLLGAYARGRDKSINADMEWVLEIFPDLRTKLAAPAGSLSGGQQTMLNIGRAVMGRPKLLLLDEPALGLDPQNIKKLIKGINQIRAERKIGVLVAEQSGSFALAFSQRIILIMGGEILFDGSWEQAAQEGKLSDVLG